MRALVTGAGGFLGLYLTEALLRNGDTVRGVCRGCYPELDALGVQCFHADLGKADCGRDQETLFQACEGVDVIFHTAAISGIGEPWEKYYRTNTLGTRNLLEAAKKAGVKTGMVNWEARLLCKDLIVVPPQYDEYLKYSKMTKSIYDRYTDLIEPFGMDECWLDVTDSWTIGSPMQIAEQIKQSVKEELGLTVSIGVSFNKIFAKLGSDMKKPDAITHITPENFRDKVWLPGKKLCKK